MIGRIIRIARDFPIGIGHEGTATNMLVTVVTYYTVAGDRLVPLEHVRVPAGWQPVILGSE